MRPSSWHRSTFRIPRVLTASITALWLALAVITVWGPWPSAAGAQVAATSPAWAQAQALLYDLGADERIGGHTLARHVGKSDDDLAERLRREPQISAASTYADEDTARRSVGAALAQSRGRVQAWASRSGFRPNLVLNYDSGGRPLGRALARGARVSAVATRALVVLRWDERRQRWFVLTSYPEARR